MQITSSAAMAVSPGTSEVNPELRENCADFEAQMTHQLLTAMRKTIPNDGLFKKSYGEELFQSMLDEELAAQMAQGKGTGFGETLYRQLIQQDNGKGGL